MSDLHLWRIGPGHHAMIATVVTHRLAAAGEFKSRLSSLTSLSHVTIEVEVCPGRMRRENRACSPKFGAQKRMSAYHPKRKFQARDQLVDL